MRRLLLPVVVALGLLAVVVSARTASYPTAVKSFTSKSNGDTIQATHINDIQDEITAIEQGLLNGLSHVLTLTNTGLHLLDTDASHDLIVKPGSDLTADHTLTLTTGDADRTLTLGGNVTLPAADLSDPGGDRIAFWDDSASAVAYLSAGAGLAISGTTITARGYMLQGGTASTLGVAFNPADSTTYYFGDTTGTSPTSTQAIARVYVPTAGTINYARVSFRFRDLTPGSAETSTVSLRLNNTTDTTISSAVTNSTSWNSFVATSLGVSVSAGDYFELKWVTPAWATNPKDVYITWQVFVE